MLYHQKDSKDAFFFPKLLKNTADTTGGKPIVFYRSFSQA
jgi:hypothetical protein